jgi:hypothetical protein
MALSPAELREIEEQSVPFTGVKREGAAELPPGVAAFPTPGEKATEIAIGTAQGTAEATPIIAGGVTGLRLGMGAAPFAGPFAPVMPAVGLGGGLIAGYLASQGITGLFPGVSREDLAPYREGGKTFGSSISFAPFAFGIPVMQGNRISRFISGIGESARGSPKIFLTSELLGGTGAGIAGGTAVAYAPDSPGARFFAEAGGGMFAPGRLVTNLGGTGLNLMRNLKTQMSESGRQGAAANKIYTALEEAGEDIPRLIKLLEQVPMQGAKPTAAQLTGSPVLSAFETTLARGNAKFSADTLTQGQEAMIAYRELIRRLERTGDPAALTAAAKARQEYNKGLLEGRLALADADSAASIVRITRDTPQTRAEIGQIVKDNTVKALKDARDYEHMLWTDAIRGLTRREVVDGRVVGRNIRPESTVQGFLDMTLDIPDIIYKNTTPKIVKEIMASFGVTDDVVKAYKNGRNTEEFMKTGQIPANYLAMNTPFKPSDIDAMDLANYRSQLLNLAREASGKGDLANARFYGQLAEGLLSDLNKLDTPGFDAARQFSKDLNDTFTRTFADDVTARNIAGGQKIPAEILVNKAYGGNADLTSLRMREIEDAAGFMLNKYRALPDRRTAEAVAMRPFAQESERLVGSIQDAQTRVLRLAAAQSIDPTTGRVQVGRLNKFVAENKEALDRLGITPDLQDAVKAENAFKAVTASNSKLAKVARDQSAFGKVLKFENPTDAVTDALNSRFPVKNISQMTKMARNAGPEAVEGLKSSLLDYAFTKAGGADDKFNPLAYKKALFDPIAPNQPSVINIMRSQGLLTQAEARNLRRITDAMDNVQLAMKNRTLMENLVTDASALEDLVMRLMGVNAAELVKPSGPGSLVMAGAFSQATRNMFEKMPNLLVRGVMEEAAKDPQLMAQLLRRGVSEGEKLRFARQLHGYLGAAGLNYATFEEPPPQQQPAPAAGPNASQMLKKLPPAPPTRGVPGMQIAPPQQAPGPQSAAPGTSRQMLASLFPFDTISGMGG